MNINTLKNISIISSVIAGIAIGICILGIVIPKTTNADFTNGVDASYAAKESIKKIKVVITAYSSTSDQTDDSPFITASNKQVRDGIVANNMLPFGTKIRIPELYGDKIFVVEDRMARRKGNYHLDIWMPDRPSALDFGVKTAEIEVLES